MQVACAPPGPKRLSDETEIGRRRAREPEEAQPK
jgi:hypothetical protein